VGWKETCVQDKRLLPMSLGRTDGGESLDLWVQPFPLPRGESPRQITDKMGYVMHPDFSPDSTQVTYDLGRAGAGAYVTSLVDGSDRWIASGVVPRFSPDGALVAFESEGKVYVVSPEDGEPRAITSELAFATRVAWLPDGERLVVLGRRSALNSRKAWIVSVNGDPVIPTGFEPEQSSWPWRWTSEYNGLLLTMSGDI
jgi:Tol biopolymer transport system component